MRIKYKLHIKNIHLFLLGIFVILLTPLFSCASMKFSGTAILTGRVCGPKGEPVQNYKLSVGTGNTVLTGVNGTFSIPEMRAGTYQISGGGKGWTSVDEQLKFYDKKTILAVQVEPMDSVYRKVETLLREKSYHEADETLDKEKKFNGNDTEFKFYKSLIAYCKSPSKYRKNRLLNFTEEKR